MQPDDLEQCRAALTRGSKTFSLAAAFLPPRARAAMTAVYAFCRVADDAVDGENARPFTIARLHRKLERAYEGAPRGPIERAIAHVAREHEVPRALFGALIEGFEWDMRGRAYETLEDVQAYGARVAGSVGVISALVMGARDRGVLARACDLGVAMQLTNIARDVGEDALHGRLYLPRAWLREEGVSPASFLARPEPSAGVRAVVRRLLERADELYARADLGIAALPGDCRVPVRAARLLYAEIGAEIARASFDSVTGRAVVPTWRKLLLVARACAARFWRPPAVQAPPLESGEFLLT